MSMMSSLVNSPRRCGGTSMMMDDAVSMPSAMAGGVPVTRLRKRICTGESGNTGVPMPSL